MKSIRKKAIPFLLAAMMAAMTACGPQSSASTGNSTAQAPDNTSQSDTTQAADTAPTTADDTGGEKTKLNFLIIAGESEMPGWNGIVNAFNASSDTAEVVLEQLPGGWTEYIQKLTALIAADAAPDIGRIGAAFVPQFVSKGQLADLKSYVDADLNMGDYFESAFKECEQDGQINGIPVGIYTMVLYYNKQMFDEAGLEYPPKDWENAWTFEQYADAARKLTKGEGANKQFGFLAQSHPERSASTVFSLGGDFFDESRTTPTFSSAPVVESYQMIQDLINVDGVSPTPAQTKTMPVDQMFLSNKLAMLAEGAWMLPAFSQDPDFEFGIAPLPKGLSSTTVSFIDQYVIFEASKNHDLAWQAVKSFVEPEAEKIMIQNNLGGIPINKTSIESEKDDLFKMLSDEDKEVLFRSVDYSRSLPFTPNWSEQMDTAMKTIDLITLGKTEVAEGMKEIDSAISALK